MTDPEWTVFVEGPSDERFLTDLLRHLDLSSVAVDRIGGGISKLPIVQNKILQTHREGRTVAVAVDADSSVAKRRQELRRVIERHDLPIADSFLLPNDEDPGCLETLLERIAVAEHQIICQCFNEYEACLSNCGSAYVLPNKKAKIYAYCEALGTETNAKKRDYGDPAYWNLDAPALDPLKEFLRSLELE